MVTFDFMVRDRRVAHFGAILETLRMRRSFTPAHEAQLRAALTGANSGTHRVLVSTRPGNFTIEFRPVEDYSDELIMDAAGTRDQRAHPTLPGPDRGWQSRQLTELRRRGAGESLLLDESGQVISAIASPLLLLEGANVHSSAHPLATPSVMLEDIVSHLVDQGLQLIDVPMGFSMPLLRRGEVWVLDAVGGVRKVSGWLEYGSILEVRPLPQRIPPTHLAVEAWRWEQATDFN
ncbi:hypothetical protein [Corynebacterium sp. A21]|uniref:hypothetical protein n=1 Tax=Corynebacterium sp. A21 TaxID=3457318 RepID=UPI003FD18FBB